MPNDDGITDGIRQAPLDRELAALADRQYGVVSLTQLREQFGLSASSARHRVAAGRLHRIHSGVYAVGHAKLGREGHYLAAVLACGSGAALSHRSAAHLGLRPTSRTAIDVLIPRAVGLRRSGIDVHRTRSLRDVTTVRGIPCTTVARTLLDLADVIDRRGLERAVEQAEVMQVFDLRALEDVLDRAVGRRGAPILRNILAQYSAYPAPTRNELEKRFFALCQQAGVPRPHVNAWIPLESGGVEVDFMWPDARLIVETDGFRTHRTRAAFERDRERDRHLTLAGWRVVRFTWRQIESDPDEVVRTLRRLLAEADRIGVAASKR